MGCFKVPILKRILRKVFRKKSRKPEQIKRGVFPESRWPIVEREPLRPPWKIMVEAIGGGAASKGSLLMGLRRLAETGKYSKSDVRKVLEALKEPYKIPQETIDSVLNSYP